MGRRITPLFGLAALFLASCAHAPVPALASCGNEDVDQTANFLKHVIDGYRKEGRFERPSEMAGYVASTMGKAEIIPPIPEFEPDAAEFYRGPRPAEGVWFGGRAFHDIWYEHFILLWGDDEKGVVVLDAYRKGETEPFYTWEI
ncbi:MAG: hypothetical protein IH945_04030 [Armatimonadetes bacterium]|nr:hypothetical protein [Armatimonadota bacterium]